MGAEDRVETLALRAGWQAAPTEYPHKGLTRIPYKVYAAC